jgi:para-nitrobenzyl esterase
VLAIAGKLYESQFSDTAFHPVVDGDLLPRLPAGRIAWPDGPTKPVVIDTTLDEARYWLYYIPELLRLPRSCGQPWLESLVGDRADEIFDAYRKQRPGLTDGQVGIAIVGDVGFRMPAIRMAEAFAARGVDTRMYLATVPSIALDGALGSPHAVELPFVFGTTAAASNFVADNDANRALSDQVQNLWVSFARGGQVGSSTTTWPQYDTKNRSTLVLDTILRVENDPYPETRKVWGDMTFDGAHPGLDRITPLQFEGTNPYDLLIIAAVVGLLVRRRRNVKINRPKRLG